MPKETQQVTQKFTLTTVKKIKPIKYNTYTPTKDDFDIPINPFSNTLKTKKKASIVQKLNVHKNLQKYKSINYHPTHINVTKNTKTTHKLRTSTQSIQRNKPQHEIHSNIRKADTNSDTLLDPFGKTNLYPIKMIPAQTQRKIMKRIRIGNKNQEAIHSHNFYSQRRFANQKKLYKDIPVHHRQTQQNNFHITPEPKRHLLNPESEEKKQNKQGKEYFRPKPLLLSHEDFYKEDFQGHHKHGFTWRDKVTFVREAMIPPVTEKVEKASVIERPEYSQPLPPLSKPKFLRDRIDSIRNYLNMVDMKPTRKPVKYFMKSASSNSEDQSQESAKFYIMREGWANHQTTTTTTVSKHKRRSRRTLFFLSPTVPYNKYF
ncbi:uncharacterized protein [Epargyreus clarus]|uniref:uncharacterized protein n=1 Tax=Epargyreus clarus TaxID=520877 RepID=UPI003C2E0C8F